VNDIESMIREIVRDEIAKAKPTNEQSSMMTVAEAAAHARVTPGTNRHDGC
jgi:hypothetical protein